MVKGDLTSMGTRAEYQTFLNAYGPAFGERLVHVRGNHDAYDGEDFASHAPLSVDLPGVTLAVLDTVVPGKAGGRVVGRVAGVARRRWPPRPTGRCWCSATTTSWNPESGRAAATPTSASTPTTPSGWSRSSPAGPRIVGYFAGHTHRNRVRRISATGDVPWVEVACVKDFPGAWAEYRVHEGGILQVFHRISTPDALAWSEKTRDMYGGLYEMYAFGSLGRPLLPDRGRALSRHPVRRG